MLCAGNQNIIMANNAPLRENVTRQRPQSALGAIADDRIADFFGSGKADPNLSRLMSRIIAALSNLKDEALGHGFGRAGGSHKIFSLAESFHVFYRWK